MTDRYNAIIVVLDKDIRDDDAQPLLTAIRMLKGVQSVEPHVSDPSEVVARMRLTIKWQNMFWQCFRAITNGDEITVKSRDR